MLIIVRSPFDDMLGDGTKTLELRSTVPPAPIRALLRTGSPLFIADKAVNGVSHVTSAVLFEGWGEITNEDEFASARPRHRVPGTRREFMRAMGYKRLIGWAMGGARRLQPRVRRAVRQGPVVWDKFRPGP